jgi:hypothetical protein
MLCAYVILSYVTCPAVPFFPHYLINETLKNAEHKICFDFLYNFCLKRVSFWKELSEMSKMPSGLRVKYLLFLSYFKETLSFSSDFRKKYQNTKFHENHFSGSLVLCGQTDIKKIIVALRNFADALM